MKKSLWILIIVVAIVIVASYVTRQIQSPSQESSTTMGSESPSVSPARPVYRSKPPVVVAPATDTRTYSQLVVAYEGKRIQFDDGCQATPRDMNYKNGTTIMLDNRSAQARTITVGSTQYAIAGHGFKIITLSSTTLPKTLSISCNANTNVSRIFLQALISQ